MRPDLAAGRVNRDMQLAPRAPRFTVLGASPLASAKEFQARGIQHDIHRPFVRAGFHNDIHRSPPPRQCGVIRQGSPRPIAQCSALHKQSKVQSAKCKVAQRVRMQQAPRPTASTAHGQHGPRPARPTASTAHGQHGPRPARPTASTANTLHVYKNITNNPVTGLFK